MVAYVIYIKWLAMALLDWLLLLTVPLAALIIAAFTREQSYLTPRYTWGGWWGTYDNPPQGDEGFVRKRSLFAGITTGWKGYLNRVHWMVRNPLYGYALLCSLKYSPGYVLTCVGNQDISDKYKIAGWYFAKLLDGSRLAGFEFYGVFPWSKTRDLRVRLGWKMVTSKFKEYGIAQLVNSINPFDGYGDN